jgi:UDP-N-acetylglucosamine diphosphorylase/glucosamine-1-phosphate N-acetyltransferase
MTHVYIFDDSSQALSPLNDLRLATDIRTGMLTSRERIAAWCRVLGWTHSHVNISRDADSVAVEDVAGKCIYLSARCPLPTDRVATLEPGQALRDSKDQTLIAACVTAPLATGELRALASSCESPNVTVVDDLHMLLSRPWHVRTFRDRCMAYDSALLTSTLPALVPPAQTIILTRQDRSFIVHAHTSAKVYPGTLFDCENGSIVLDDQCVIRPGAQLIGPCYVGAHSTVLERATIRPGTCIGPWCKVNGEVGGTIFQGFANKAHDGYVGDSYIGEWVNLGAGTTTSNLLNTYGEVITKQAPGRSNERTGEQFLGSIIGDHTKTAICTRLMTGTIVHFGAMIASTQPATGCLPPFAWVTDAGTRSYRLDKFIEVMTAAMARRNITPSLQYTARVAELHSAEVARLQKAM